MQVLFPSLLFILGACLGSFLCCQARRLHLKTKKPSKRLGSRSVCLDCGYQLKWYDNLPIISWLFLKGKCRKCHHKIGIAEFLSELALALAFLAYSLTFNYALASPLEWAIFITTLLLVLTLGFLAIYDGLYGELPTSFLIISIIIALIILCLKEWQFLSAAPFTINLVYEPALSVLILGGTYLILYLVGKGKWVGDGDWLLATAIGIALFKPMQALIALFLANLIACLVMAPIVKGKRGAKIYLGPFLVIAFVITSTINLCIF